MKFSEINILDFFKEVSKSTKFQLSAAITFGIATSLVWMDNSKQLEILLTILFLFPTCMFVFSLFEKLYIYVDNRFIRRKAWDLLTPEELKIISYYIDNNTKTRYVPVYNGTYTDSGIINPLMNKGILYLASMTSEYRGDDWMTKEQHFPINIHDDAFLFFSKKLIREH